MRTKRSPLYMLSGEQVVSVRDKLKWSRSRFATYLSVSKTTMKHYEQKGISNGVIAQRLSAIAQKNGISFTG